MGKLHEIRRPRPVPRVWRNGLTVAALAAAAAYGLNALDDSHAALRPTHEGADAQRAVVPSAPTRAASSEADSFSSHYNLQATERAEPIATF